MNFLKSIFKKLFLSLNFRNIDTIYLTFALFAGLLGTSLSILIRIELSGPGVQYISNNQLYNSIVTAHAIVMIFFMVIPGLILGFIKFLCPLKVVCSEIQPQNQHLVIILLLQIHLFQLVVFYKIGKEYIQLMILWILLI